MSKAEKFIQDYTMNCSNLLYRDYVGGFDRTAYQPWLTPDQARKAVEIEKEELIDKVCEFLKDHLDGYDIPKNDIERSIETFKLAMED